MRYVLYCKGRRPCDQFTRAFVPIFEDPGQAKTFISVFMGNEPIIPRLDVLSWGEAFTLKTTRLADILDAPDGVMMPEHYHRQILQFKYGSWDEPPKAKETITDDGKSTAPSLTRERRPARPAGYVTITELATTWGIPALQARAALRATDRIKPAYGWAFDPKEADAIKKLVMA